jgi:hypothetical protein
MVLPIETARQAMDILREQPSMTDAHLRRTTYVAGILQSATSNARVVLLASAGENARGFTQQLVEEVEQGLQENHDVPIVVQGWVNAVDGLTAALNSAGARPAGNDAEQQLLRLNGFAFDHEDHADGPGLYMDEALLSERLSDTSYTSETGDDIPPVDYRRSSSAGEGSAWINPILALKTSRAFCSSCTEAVQNEGLQITSEDRTEAQRGS